MLFTTLRRIRAFEQAELLGVLTILDRDILWTLGEADDRGASIGFKQLEHIDLAPVATLRRSLSRLIDNGWIAKESHKTDGRIVVYKVTAKFHECLDALKTIFRMSAYQLVARESSVEANSKNMILYGAKNHSEALKILRDKAEKFCEVNNIQFSCSQNPNCLFFAMIEVADEHSAQIVAAELGGQVFGFHLVCAFFPIGPDFVCNSKQEGVPCTRNNMLTSG